MMRVPRLEGTESFRDGDRSAPLSALDFWKWSASDVVTNSSRGVLAEYIVASALGIATGVRMNWDAFDLKLDLVGRSVSIEVKSSSYVQAWFQKALSKPSFSIRPCKAWDPETSQYGKETKRHADIYVFCLLAHTDQETLNPFDLSQWDFYVVPTAELNTRFQTRKNIPLSALTKAGYTALPYSQLAQEVRSLATAITGSESLQRRTSDISAV